MTHLRPAGERDRPLEDGAVFAGLPAVRPVPPAEVAAAVQASGRRIVVLDDDPTGTQTVAGVPVLTTWSVADLRWALQQPAPAFYVLTNTRSLAPLEAEARLREIVEALVEASRLEGVGYVVASRGDSTLRGHYPLETDVLADVLGKQAGTHVDGVVIAPAYVEGGRLTVDSVHWLRAPGGMLPVGNSEFAKDATFGYRSSDLREYVEEKTSGRWRAGEVGRITLWDLRQGGVEATTSVLVSLSDGRPVVVDATCDDDLRVLSLALDRAESAGKTFLYRVGPSFVRARAGLEARPPLTTAEVEAIRLSAGSGSAGGSSGSSSGGDDRPASSPHGLVVVGSHVAQTTRQLEGLRQLAGITEIGLEVAQLLDPDRRDEAVRSAADAAVASLGHSEVVVTTSREIVTGRDADASLAIARSVSAALVELVRAVLGRTTPSWVVGKGGITSSDVATGGLGIRRAWVRGTLLPGIVSLWEPVAGSAAGIPYVVFAGNVGDDAALAEVVVTLRGRP